MKKLIYFQTILLALLYHTAATAQTDEEAIKQQIIAESNAYFSRNYKEWADAWRHDSTSSWTVVGGTGKAIHVAGWPAILKFHAHNFKPGQPAHNYGFTRKDYQISLVGEVAIASFVQIMLAHDRVRTSNEFRVFRRKDATWKLVTIKSDLEPITYQRLVGFQLIPISGLFVLAMLHLALFLLDRRQRTNLYFCLFMGNFALALTGRYVAFSGVDSHWSPAIDIISVLLIPLTASRFVYSVCQTRVPGWVWIGLVGGILSLTWAYWPLHLISNDFLRGFTVFFVLIMVDISRIIVRAILRRQPGIWLIGVGLLLSTLMMIDMGTDVIGLQNRNDALNTLLFNLGFLSIPLTSSLYLAGGYIRNNFSLESQSSRVAALTEQMLVQQQDKARLLAEQNEQLERQVLTRTQEIQAQNDQLAQQKTAIEQQAQALSELDGLKTRFFTNITHEFRTPLTLMLGPAEQIITQSREEPSRQNARLVHRNAQRLLILINQLLDLGKIEAGRLALQPQPGDLLAFVKGITYGFESFATEQQLSLQFDANCSALPTRFDRDQWEKILTNLLSNALKFTPAGGTTDVRFHYDDFTSVLTLAVADSGRGIPAHQVAHVFDRFYQGDSSDTRSWEGTGIGLALTKELVELHGGRISLTSSAGVGTTVCLQMPIQLLPQVMDSEQEADQSSVSIPTVLHDTKPDAAKAANRRLGAADTSSVLVVDDNADVRAFIRSALEAHHYTILQATNGEEGLYYARQHVPNLVITDLMMPKLDGHAFCRALKADERTSHIPVVMLTAKAGVDSRIAGLQTGADSYLAKPFHTGELVAQVANLIQGREQLRNHYRRLSLFGLDKPALPSMEQVFLERVRRVIDEQLGDEQFSVETVCDAVGMSRMQLHRKLKALLDLSPGDLIRLVRLERAHALLLDNVGTVAEVAYAVGFSNPANFSTSFSRHFGYSPSAVRQQVVGTTH